MTPARLAEKLRESLVDAESLAMRLDLHSTVLGRSPVDDIRNAIAALDSTQSVRCEVGECDHDHEGNENDHAYDEWKDSKL